MMNGAYVSNGMELANFIFGKDSILFTEAWGDI